MLHAQSFKGTTGDDEARPPAAAGVAYTQLVESVLPPRQHAPLHKLDFTAQFVDVCRALSL